MWWRTTTLGCASRSTGCARYASISSPLWPVIVVVAARVASLIAPGLLDPPAESGHEGVEHHICFRPRRFRVGCSRNVERGAVQPAERDVHERLERDARQVRLDER